MACALVKNVVGLKGLNNSLLKIDNDKFKRNTSLNEFEKNNIEYYTKHELYADPINNNVVVAVLDGFKKESLPDIALDSVSSHIESKAYNYLINILNANTNTLIVWVQCEGMESDYTIFYNVVDTCFTGLPEVYELAVIEGYEDSLSDCNCIEVNGKIAKKILL